MLSAEALAFFQQLYDIEDRALDFSPDQRRNAAPAARRRPIIGSLRTWLDRQLQTALPKLKFGEAVRCYTTSGSLWSTIWTTVAYRSTTRRSSVTLRALTIGRNNWLFIGSPQAGPRAAVLYTLVASAARHDLDVWAYLCDVLQRLAVLRQRLDGSPLPPELLTPLLPDVWAEAHPEAIRSYRQHERESRAAAKRVRREKRRAQARASRNPPG